MSVLIIKTLNPGPLTGWLLKLCFVAIICVSCQEQSSNLSDKNTPDITTSESKSDPIPKMVFDDFPSNVVTEIDNDVLCILQDSQSNYWFGTNKGAYCYNGKSILLFTTVDGLFQNQIQSIQEDHFGNIWFNTGGYGVNCFNGKEFSTFTVQKNIHVEAIPEKDWKLETGDLWFYAGGGAFYYDKIAFIYLPFIKPRHISEYHSLPAYEVSPFGVYSILKDSNGNVWFGTQSMGVCKYDGETFQWFTEYGLQGPAVLDIFEDSRGHLWFGTNGNGVFRYDGNTLRNFTEEMGLSNPDFIKLGKEGPGTLARVWTINEDKHGNIWFGTGDAGAWSYDGEKLKNFTQKDGLPNAAIEAIYRDKQSALWVGTNGAGLYKWNGENFEKFGVE